MPPGPIRALRFVHTAIRNETASLADRAAALASPAEAATLADDFSMLARVLRGHARGEDVGYFSTLDARVPGLCAPFVADHADEDQRLEALGADLSTCATPEALDDLRARLAHLCAESDAHMTREEEQLWPRTEAELSPPEQGAIIQAILAVIPKEEFPAMIPWIVARNPDDEAVAYVRMLQQVQPPPVFELTRGWLRDGLDPAQWALLAEQVDGLA